jgi:hypothetical protein
MRPAASQQQARPSLKVDPFGEKEALRPPGREHPRNVLVEQSRDDRRALGGHHRAERGRETAQGVGQNIGEDEIVRRAAAQFPTLDADRDERAQIGADAIKPRVFPRHGDGNGIDVAQRDADVQHLGGGDRQHARAAANVEHPARAAAPKNALEMQEAAARRAVMAGAESQRRLDFDGDVVSLDASAVMGAMNEKTPRAHRGQTRQRIGDPVALGRSTKFERRRRRVAGRRGDKLAQRILVGRKAEIDLDHPGFAAPFQRRLGLEGGRRRLRRLEAFDDKVGDRARPRFIADETHHVGGVVGGQAFQHSAC